MAGNIYKSGDKDRGTNGSDGFNYRLEREAIVALRRAYPNHGPYQLARLIHLRRFDMGVDNALADTVGYRPYLSILAVIRRYDARLRSRKVAA